MLPYAFVTHPQSHILHRFCKNQPKQQITKHVLFTLVNWFIGNEAILIQCVVGNHPDQIRNTERKTMTHESLKLRFGISVWFVMAAVFAAVTI